jgi:hypothetical protein
MDKSDRQISFNNLKKFMTSLPATIDALGSPLGPHLESDLVTDLNSSSTPIAIMDESDRHISFNNLKKFMISLPATIGALGSPLGPHLESNLATYLYFGSTPITIMDESDRQVDFNRLNKSAISLSAVIRALSSPLGPHSESNLAIYLYSGSTLIAIKTNPIVESVLNDFKKYTTSL